MADDLKTESPPRRSLFKDRRFWSLVIAIAITVTFLYDHKAFLENTTTASFNLAGYVEKHFTPGSFEQRFHARATQCDYHWLFVCEAPAPRDCRKSALGFPLCLPASDSHSVLDPNRYRPGPQHTDVLSGFWSGVLTLGQVPDATWYVFKEAWADGFLAFVLLGAFALINLVVATRLPLAALPIVFPLSVAVSSGLFWILQQLLVLGAGVVGVVFLCLALIAGLPSIIISLFSWIVETHNFRDFIHEVRKALGFAKEIIADRGH